MDQKHIGIILIIVSIMMSSFVYVIYSDSEKFADEYMFEKGTCFLEDGTCIHKERLPLFIFGWVISGTLLLFGAYLAFIDKTQKFMAEHQIKVSSALETAMKQEREKDEFKAYLAGFNEGGQKVLKAIKDQEGIKQSTLRYKTGISKTALSLILKGFEENKIISRKPSGKTKEIFLIKKF